MTESKPRSAKAVFTLEAARAEILRKVEKGGAKGAGSPATAKTAEAKRSLYMQALEALEAEGRLYVDRKAKPKYFAIMCAPTVAGAAGKMELLAARRHPALLTFSELTKALAANEKALAGEALADSQSRSPILGGGYPQAGYRLRSLRKLMKTATALQPLGENLWLLGYPLRMLGVDLRRNVAVIRLASGKLVIHSSGPFAGEDVAAIRALGQPSWLLEGILRHDTFAQEGRAAFPEVIYLAPPGFSETVGFPTIPVVPAPAEWGGELLALEIAGAPEASEVALLHLPSRTLILTELVFNFADDQPLWADLLLRVAVGEQHHPGMPRPVKHGVKDEAAFKGSLQAILDWDFDRVIVGHGDVIESGGKEKLRAALAAAGF